MESLLTEISVLNEAILPDTMRNTETQTELLENSPSVEDVMVVLQDSTLDINTLKNHKDIRAIDDDDADSGRRVVFQQESVQVIL